jgi:circadian clock protein KaiC
MNEAGAMSKSPDILRGITKSPTGIQGLDEITGGGLPTGRPTLVCGSAGCGKTLCAMEFLVRGALQYGEPGVFMSFEESESELAANVASLGFDLLAMVESGLLILDHVIIDPNEIEEAGDYDLEGLFLRLGLSIDAIGAKRVVLDTLEALFSGFRNEIILRAELVRLFRWLKDRGVTAVITGERGEGMLTRHGLEEYISDCVISLDHRVRDQVSTRRLRIVKYRGTHHGTNEYPFLIDREGFSVLPVTSLGLYHEVHTERVSTGVDKLDQMMGGAGYYRGSSVLVSGTPGTGKSTLSAHFADATCRRGERCLYFAFEESPAQIIRNMRSVGIDLGRWQEQGLLEFHAVRPTLHGLELHLANTMHLIARFRPAAVIVDPLTALSHAGAVDDAASSVLRMVDHFKVHGITGLFTSLTHGGDALEATTLQISSLMDTWILVRDIELGGERNRGIYVLKSRGMNHSNQIREFVITSQGIDLLEVYTGPQGVLTGSARISREAEERSAAMMREQELAHMHRELERKRKILEVRIESMRAEFETEHEALQRKIAEAEARDRSFGELRSRLATRRGGEVDPSSGNGGA